MTKALNALQFVPVASLRPSKTNPRKSIDPAFIAELAASVRKDGVLTALLLRPHPQREIGHDPDNEVYEVVSGEQRYRAAKEAGLDVVPALVRDLNDEQVMNIQLVENLKRRDLTPLEEADGYNHLVKTGAKVERIAEEIGRSVEYVYDRLRLMSLVGEVRDLLLHKRIELGHALLLATLEPDDQRRALREDDGGLWERQRTLYVPDALVTDPKKPARSDDSYKAVSVKELKLWIDDRVKFRIDAPHNLQLFPDTVAAVQKAEESKTKIVHITAEHQVHPDAKDEKGPRVYSVMSWKRADGKGKSKTCDHSALGIIDVGPLRGQALMVCVDRKHCTVHFGDVIRERKAREKEVATSGKTGEDRHKFAKEKAAAARKESEAKAAAITRALPAIRLAVAKQLASVLPIANIQVIITKTLDDIGAFSFGVVNDASKLVPPGKTLESWLRNLAARLTLYSYPEDLIDLCKEVTVDAEKIIAAQAAPVVDTCRVCKCTDAAPCRFRKTPTGPLEACGWAEAPDKKGLGLCTACAIKTGNKAAAKKATTKAKK